MKILFDIVHPADVLFYLNPIRMLRGLGHEAVIASRDKDVTLDLLEAHDLDHVPVSRAGNGPVGLGLELLRRDLALIKMAWREKVDVLTGFGGISASHAAALLRKPAVVFYDTDTARLQNRLTYPFLTELHVPHCYGGTVPVARTHRFAGLKEVSYLHPDYFQPNHDIAIANGLDPERDNYFLRVVGWGASHDVGEVGWSDEMLSRIVERLSGRGRVHISSERPLPDNLADLRYSGKIHQVHHMIAHCRLYLGESATMAAEACVLGVPAIFAGPICPSYITELERRGLLRFIPSADESVIMRNAEDLLGRPQSSLQGARQTFLDDTVDVAAYVTEALIRRGPSARTP